VPHVAALSSGTAGLHLALQLLGVGRGDEVMVSSLTFAATANAITYVGARPVFVDATAASWNLDPALVAEELDSAGKRGNLPKAVIAVNLLASALLIPALGIEGAALAAALSYGCGVAMLVALARRRIGLRLDGPAEPR
jgi:dTDP-4-amino-4,6-dideoxygalactose transaminase